MYCCVFPDNRGQQQKVAHLDSLSAQREANRRPNTQELQSSAEKLAQEAIELATNSLQNTAANTPQLPTQSMCTFICC